VKILVVDDDLELSSLIGYALRQAGYVVVEAGDGQAALETFERESPALVVLDACWTPTCRASPASRSAAGSAPSPRCRS
jgi:DNA-binding response OmpR family regulator